MWPRWTLSIFLVCHLAALAVAAVPSPNDLRLAVGLGSSEERPWASNLEGAPSAADEPTDDAVSARVRPLFDAAGDVVVAVARHAWRLTAFARPFTDRYVDSLGLSQTWNMFANPPRGSEYLRFRYYSVADAAGDNQLLTLATELVFPAAPSTEPRLVRAYWESHRDKAISNALSAYFRARLRLPDAGRVPPSADDPVLDDALSRSFLPVVRYFSERYAREHLRTGDRLVRTEAWYGWATSRARGDVRIAPRARAAAVGRYYGGLTEERVPRPIFQKIDSVEREADLLWMLLMYVETP